MTGTLHHDRGTSPPVVDRGDGADRPDPGEGTVPLSRRGAQDDGDRRRRRLAVAVVVAAVAGVVGLAVAVPTPEPTEDVETGLGLPGRGGGGASATVGPAVLRSRPVTALTPTHLLVWAGEDGTGAIDRADGFSVSLGSGAVEPIPNAPVTRLRETDGAWTGSELVVVSSRACASCGTPEPAAAAWAPEDGWRVAADPPASISDGTVGAVWTGDNVVVVARSGVATAYDPSTDRWVDVPPVGIEAAGTPSLVWTGTQVVYWATDASLDATEGPGTAPTTPTASTVDRGWAWTPGASAWQPLPDLPEGHRTRRGSAVWTGAGLVVWGAAAGTVGTDEVVGVGAVLRSGDERWTPLPGSPQGPAEGFEGTPGSQVLTVDPTTGSVVVLPLDPFGGTRRDLLVLDADRGSWTTTDVGIGEAEPTFAVVDRMLLVPHPGNPVAARLP